MKKKIDPNSAKYYWTCEFRKIGTHGRLTRCPERFDLESGASTLASMLRAARPDLDVHVVRDSVPAHSPEAQRTLL